MLTMAAEVRGVNPGTQCTARGATVISSGVQRAAARRPGHGHTSLRITAFIIFFFFLEGNKSKMAREIREKEREKEGKAHT